MKRHEINKLNNFISGYYIDNTIICDKIINWFKTEDTVEPGMVYRKSENPFVDLHHKHSFDTHLNNNRELLSEYLQHLQKVLDYYFVDYTWANSFAPFANREVINVQYYPPGGGYFTWHCERGSSKHPVTTRHLVFMTYLNDVTDAGETEFYHQKIKVKPEKGLTLIWPADWTFTHRGVTSPTQEKYIVTGWMNYFE